MDSSERAASTSAGVRPLPTSASQWAQREELATEPAGARGAVISFGSDAGAAWRCLASDSFSPAAPDLPHDPREERRAQGDAGGDEEEHAGDAVLEPRP